MAASSSSSSSSRKHDRSDDADLGSKRCKSQANDCAMSLARGTITLTLGDQAENHVGMQKIGELAEEGSGFSHADLVKAQELFESQGAVCELVELATALKGRAQEATPAYVLIVRKGVDYILHKNEDGVVVGHDWATDFFNEQAALDADKKARMYGRVVQKHARHNLCFSELPQEPNYAEGKGRIVAYADVPLLQRFRENLPLFLGEKSQGLVTEGNYYYDVAKCGIGFHGDAERRKVVAIRLGCSLPLHYQWFQNSKPVGERIKLVLHHGDVYVMSEKATGFDFKKKLQLTLRHAAGADKYLRIKE